MCSCVSALSYSFSCNSDVIMCVGVESCCRAYKINQLCYDVCCFHTSASHTICHQTLTVRILTLLLYTAALIKMIQYFTSSPSLPKVNRRLDATSEEISVQAFKFAHIQFISFFFYYGCCCEFVVSNAIVCQLDIALTKPLYVTFCTQNPFGNIRHRSTSTEWSGNMSVIISHRQTFHNHE